MEKKVVVHIKDGSVLKGVTQNFSPGAESFYLLPAEGGGVPIRVKTDGIKALFYVKTYMGNRDFVAQQAFDEARRAERKAIVKFKDGEEIWGYLGEQDENDDIGFFFMPADKGDNNLRIYVIHSAIAELKQVS
jgi:small nuclear ribonucleoprotein (snRNP)-like protein